MNRREVILLGLVAATGAIPSSSSEAIRRDKLAIKVPDVVKAYARNVEELRNDTILRAGSVLFYGSTSVFPGQGALIKDNGTYYVGTIKHTLSTISLKERKLGIYIPLVGHFEEDARKLSTKLSESPINDDIIALPLNQQQQDIVRVLEALGYILPLQFRREFPKHGEMIAVPHPETANYSYHRITDVLNGVITLEQERMYQNPPVCSGHSGAPLLFVNEASGQTTLTNEIVGVQVGALVATEQYIDMYNRLCSNGGTIAQLHNRSSSKP